MGRGKFFHVQLQSGSLLGAQATERRQLLLTRRLVVGAAVGGLDCRRLLVKARSDRSGVVAVEGRGRGEESPCAGVGMCRSSLQRVRLC